MAVAIEPLNALALSGAATYNRTNYLSPLSLIPLPFIFIS